MCKKNAAIVLTASQPFTSSLVMSNVKEFKYCWYWRKRPFNFLNAKKQPLRDTEDVLVFGGYTYNPQGLIACRKVNKRSCSASSCGSHGLSNVAEWKNYPVQTLVITDGERGLHPTQKPVALMEYLIRTYTNEGDTVLDNCMGSGTTGVACANSNRRFIGIEREETYFRLASDRVENAFNPKQMKLELK